MSETTRKTIGQLNGPWAFLQKFMLLLFPLVIAWGVWTTTSIFQLRADLQAVHELDLRLLRLESLKIPPVWFEQKVTDLQSDVTCLKATVQRLELLLTENQILLKEHMKIDRKADVSCLDGSLENAR